MLHVDPIIIMITAGILWLFWLACALHDRKHPLSAETDPRRDTMPSVSADLRQ